MSFRDMIAKHPLEVIIYRRTQNALIPMRASGRYEKSRVLLDNTPVDRRYLVIKERVSGMPLMKCRYRRIPMFPYEAFVSFNESNIISLLQVDINTFLPIDFKEGVLFAIAIQNVYDAEGKQVVDETGKPKTQVVKQPLFDSNLLVIDEGKDAQGDNLVRVEKIPYALAHKISDKEQWVGMELATNVRLHATGGLMEKYGTIIITVITVLALVAIGWYFSESVKESAKITAQAIYSVAGNICGSTSVVAGKPPV